MLRRSRLARKTGLRQGGPLRARARATRIPPAVCDLLAARSGGRCEAALISCTGLATQRHHRITQKAGGRHGAAKERHDRLTNLLHLCPVCHGWVTLRAGAEANEVGLSLKEWQDPAREPVLYRGDLAYLDDQGGRLPFEEVGP